jgi:hypothetical protein
MFGMCSCSDILFKRLSQASVPLSKLSQIIQDTKDDLEQSGIVYNVVGHAGEPVMIQVQTSKPSPLTNC